MTPSIHPDDRALEGRKGLRPTGTRRSRSSARISRQGSAGAHRSSDRRSRRSRRLGDRVVIALDRNAQGALAATFLDAPEPLHVHLDEVLDLTDESPGGRAAIRAALARRKVSDTQPRGQRIWLTSRSARRCGDRKRITSALRARPHRRRTSTGASAELPKRACPQRLGITVFDRPRHTSGQQVWGKGRVHGQQG